MIILPRFQQSEYAFALAASILKLQLDSIRTRILEDNFSRVESDGGDVDAIGGDGEDGEDGENVVVESDGGDVEATGGDSTNGTSGGDATVEQNDERGDLRDLNLN